MTSPGEERTGLSQQLVKAEGARGKKVEKQSKIKSKVLRKQEPCQLLECKQQKIIDFRRSFKECIRSNQLLP